MNELEEILKNTAINPQAQLNSDLQVEREADYLLGKKITVCVGSGIAAIEGPKIVRQLRRYGADVTVMMTPTAAEYFGTVAYQWASGKPVVTELTGAVEHIRDDDAALVLPATLDTIGQIVHGQARNAMTTYLSSAIGRGIPITIVPSMHESMYNNPFFQDNLRNLGRAKNINVLEPRRGEGKAKTADKRTVVAEVTRSASTDPLKGKKILMTAGPTRAYLDPVRFITNMSSGKLGLMIANDLYLRGADVTVVYGPGKVEPESYLNIKKVKTPDEMLDAVVSELENGKYGEDYDAAIFSAAVSDYIPKQAGAEKKIRSGKELSIELEPTKKIITEVDKVIPRRREPHLDFSRFFSAQPNRQRKKLFKVGFKLETADSDEELLDTAHTALLKNKSHLVVANNLGDIGAGKHRAMIVTPERGYQPAGTKEEIVSVLADELGRRLNSTFYHTVTVQQQSDTAHMLPEFQRVGKVLAEQQVLPSYGTGTFGNMSVRDSQNSVLDDSGGFVITARCIDKGNLTKKDLVRVVKIDHEKCYKHVFGKQKPSSDTVAHSMMYERFPEYNALVHVHDDTVLKNAERLGITSTHFDYPCGSRELGEEVVAALERSQEGENPGFIALKDHGVLAAAEDLDAATAMVLDYHARAEGLE